MADSIRYGQFSGINNVKRAWELDATELVTCTNYDIDNAKRLVQRPGRTKVSSLDVRDATPFKSAVYGQVDGNLVITKDLSAATTLVSGIGTQRLYFAEVEDLLVWSNGSVIQYIFNETSYQFSQPSGEFKVKPVPGKLAYYMGCLYMAAGDTLWQSDPVATGFAIDKNPANGGSSRVFGSKITMIVAVANGLWVSDEQSLWWCAGGNLQEMQRVKLDNCYTYDGAYCEVRPGITGIQGLRGITWYAATNKGIALLGSDGNVLLLTEDRYNMPAATSGTMAFTQRDGLNQVITILDL